MSESSKDPREGDATTDLFEGHLAFLADYESRRAITFADRITMQPLEPLGVNIEAALDFDALEAIASWQGLFRQPRDKRPAELDPDVESQMKECMPQFHLRNIGRAERIADPDDDLELSHEQVEYGLRAPGAVTALPPRYTPPPLLEESNLDAVQGYRERMRWLISETPWSRHFCQELKESVRGPLWRYDPDAEPDGGEQR